MRSTGFHTLQDIHTSITPQQIFAMAFPPPGFMFHSLHEDQDHLTSSPLNHLPSCPTPHFQGRSPFVMKRSVSFSGIDNRCDEGHVDDELSDDGSQLGEKKKRLNLEQVRALEKSFELGNKLEPERKLQLAKALGLQPRQIAIWFQNRRARLKIKQLEKDYDVLKKQFEALKSDNDSLHNQNKKLHDELLSLKGRGNGEAGTMNLKKEKEVSWSNGSDSSSDINLEMSRHNSNVDPVIINSSSLSSQTVKKFLASPATRSPSITQFLQGSSGPDLQGLKLDHQMAQEETFCNMFNGIDEQQHNFWPWQPGSQQHFH